MSEERFEFTINSNGQADIIDKVESKEKNAICIYNDLGVPPYSSAKAVCNKLNEQEETINELKQRNQRQYNRLKELTELMYEKQWGKLENMVDEWEKADELLEQEWGTYCGDKE